MSISAAQAHSAALLANSSGSITSHDGMSHKSSKSNSQKRNNKNRMNQRGGGENTTAAASTAGTGNGGNNDDDGELERMLAQAEILASEMRKSASSLSSFGSSRHSINSGGSSGHLSTHAEGDDDGNGEAVDDEAAAAAATVGFGGGDYIMLSGSSNNNNNNTATIDHDNVSLEMEQERILHALDVLSQPSYDSASISASISASVASISRNSGSNTANAGLIANTLTTPGTGENTISSAASSATDSTDKQQDVEAAIRASQEMAKALQALSLSTNKELTAATLSSAAAAAALSPSVSPKNAKRQVVDVIYEDLSSEQTSSYQASAHDTTPLHGNGRKIFDSSSALLMPGNNTNIIAAAADHNSNAKSRQVTAKASRTLADVEEELGRNVTQVKWEKIDFCQDGDDDYVQLKDYSKSSALSSVSTSSSSRQVVSSNNKDAVQWEKMDLVTNQQDADYSPMVDYSKQRQKQQQQQSIPTTSSASLLRKIPPSSSMLRNSNPQQHELIEPSSMSPQERRRRRAATAAAQKRRRRKFIKICLAIVILLVAIATGYHLFSSSSTISSSSSSSSATPEMHDQSQARTVQEDETAAATAVQMENSPQEIRQRDSEAHYYAKDDTQDADLAYHQDSGHQEEMVDDGHVAGTTTEATIGGQEFASHDDDLVLHQRGEQGVYLHTPVPLRIIQHLFFGSWMFGKEASRRGHTLRPEHVEDFLQYMMQ